MGPTTDLAWKACVNIAMWGPIAVIVLLVTYFIVADIIHGVKFKKQSKRFGELYKMCIEKHGLTFAQKVYKGCTEPLWIGMDKMISVFEHHCGIQANKT